MVIIEASMLLSLLTSLSSLMVLFTIGAESKLNHDRFESSELTNKPSIANTELDDIVELSRLVNDLFPSQGHHLLPWDLGRQPIPSRLRSDHVAMTATTGLSEDWPSLPIATNAHWPSPPIVTGHWSSPPMANVMYFFWHPSPVGLRPMAKPLKHLTDNISPFDANEYGHAIPPMPMSPTQLWLMLNGAAADQKRPDNFGHGHGGKADSNIDNMGIEMTPFLDVKGEEPEHGSSSKIHSKKLDNMLGNDHRRQDDDDSVPHSKDLHWEAGKDSRLGEEKHSLGDEGHDGNTNENRQGRNTSKQDHEDGERQKPKEHKTFGSGDGSDEAVNKANDVNVLRTVSKEHRKSTGNYMKRKGHKSYNIGVVSLKNHRKKFPHFLSKSGRVLGSGDIAVSDMDWVVKVKNGRQGANEKQAFGWASKGARLASTEKEISNKNRKRVFIENGNSHKENDVESDDVMEKMIAEKSEHHVEGGKGPRHERKQALNVGDNSISSHSQRHGNQRIVSNPREHSTSALLNGLTMSSEEGISRSSNDVPGKSDGHHSHRGRDLNKNQVSVTSEVFGEAHNGPVYNTQTGQTEMAKGREIRVYRESSGMRTSRRKRKSERIDADENDKHETEKSKSLPEKKDINQPASHDKPVHHNHTKKVHHFHHKKAPVKDEKTRQMKMVKATTTSNKVEEKSDKDGVHSITRKPPHGQLDSAERNRSMIALQLHLSGHSTTRGARDVIHRHSVMAVIIVGVLLSLVVSVVCLATFAGASSSHGLRRTNSRTPIYMPNELYHYHHNPAQDEVERRREDFTIMD